MTSPSIKYLFEPRNVAIIGASTNPRKIGYKIIENILYSAYKGNIFPVNPQGGTIQGLKVYKTIIDIPDDNIDLVTICIPAKYVLSTVKEAAKKKVKFLSIITSGFAEIGNLVEERELVEFANSNGMRILGPNIFGIYSAAASLNATFGSKGVTKGKVAIVTQSGALGIALIGKTEVEGIGLSAIVSVGNKSDIDEADLLEYLVEDENTKVIMLYIEGVTNGDNLSEILKVATQKKPIVVIKSGRSKRGAMAAASHTGSLAGSDKVFSDVMKQSGALRAESVQEALNWCKFLSISDLPKGMNTVIVTNGGGIGVLATDACEKYDVPLYDDQPTLKEIFKDVTPSFGSTKNPVDITGQARYEEYKSSLDAALNNDDIDSVICLGCETAVFDSQVMTKTIEEIVKESSRKKPLVFSFVGGKAIEVGIINLKARGIPIFGEVYEAVSCLGSAYAQYRNTYVESESIEVDLGINFKEMSEVIKTVRENNRTFMLSHEAIAFMQAAGVTMPLSYNTKTLDEAIMRAEEIGYPVVMKIISEDIIHKSDAGGVAVDLDNRDEVIDAYQAIRRNAKNYKADAKIQGVEVVEMVKSGVETLVGAIKDKSFGPIITFGLGGIYVEVMKDVSFRASPVSRRDVISMIKDTKAYTLLLGVRGEDRKDIEKVIDVILRLSAIIEYFKKDLSDIEINPLIVYDQGEGVKCVDARIILTNPEVK